ncbi:hypothetical protein TDB9533_00561 [Thalassocella blandensis]|nr:hypothetical protein TDB9533_00561 [Thalassocella blandensis]
MNNIIVNVDSYKTSHYLQYPPETTHVSSYIEARGGAFQQSIFFGLQAFIKAYLCKPITQENILEAEELFAAHGVPFNKAGWQYILDKYQGFLPIEIEALPEGTLIPVQNVMAQVTNTDPQCAWLTSYLETALLRAVWYPTTVATKSRECKKVIEKYLLETAGHSEGLEFKLHDFGARGASSAETAAIGGLAHLVNFKGTDTVAALLAARQFYRADMAGFSIPAAEHSTITAWGEENEVNAYENMLVQFSGPGKVVAVVSDSYDLWNALDNLWGKALKEKVENNGGTVVIRPDSGDPVTIVVKTVEKLMARFGCTTNALGYRVLPDYIRVIQGDGISLQSIEAILEAMKNKHLSAENVAFGMGAELLQKVNRDTLQFAMKASAIKIAGEWQDVYKDPITDQGKASKKGRLAVVKLADGGFETVRREQLADRTNQLVTVFKDGKLLTEYHFDEVRAAANAPLTKV